MIQDMLSNINLSVPPYLWCVYTLEIWVVYWPDPIPSRGIDPMPSRICHMRLGIRLMRVFDMGQTSVRELDGFKFPFNNQILNIFTWLVYFRKLDHSVQENDECFKYYFCLSLLCISYVLLILSEISTPCLNCIWRYIFKCNVLQLSKPA